MDKYEHEGVVGEGSYGVVIKCRHRDTGQVVAIKKFLETDEDQTVKKIAMREIRMLKRLRHDNLINLIEVFRRRRKLYLVFEYVDHTVLDELEDNVRGLKPAVARSHIYQVLRGVEFCHNNQIIHRDVKPENVLVSKLGVVKLCDFGFARLMAAPGEVYTDYVATRWYRAPELLVGDTQYGKEVDVWAVGCLYSEMMSGEPLFPGESDIDQLFQITQVLGPLATKHRQIVSKNPMFSGLNAPASSATTSTSQNNSSSIANKLSHWSTESLSFLKSCLEMEPEKRLSCSLLLKAVLFTHDNFHITFPPQLQSKLQQEFGSYLASGKKKPSNSRKHLQKVLPTEEGEKRSMQRTRKQVNSETFDAFFGQDLQAKSSLLAGIYSPSKTKEPTPEPPHKPGAKIVAPPPTLTSDMGQTRAGLSSARSEVDVNASSKPSLKSRQLGFQSPDERGNLQAPSPQGLKRYEGIEQGLNQLTTVTKGAPYKLSDPGALRNKSPPLKKTKRKETYPPVNPPHHLNPIHVAEDKHEPNKAYPDIGGIDQHRFTMLERAFDRHFQIDELPSTPRERTDSNPPPTPQSLHTPATPTRNLWSQGPMDISRWPRGQNPGPFSRGPPGASTLTNLTNILSNSSHVEPLSLPSVNGAGSRQGHHQPNSSQKTSKAWKGGSTNEPQITLGHDRIDEVELRPPSHNLPHV